METLYHYTSKHHLVSILNDGFLKLTESNLKYKGGMYKPVVWFTELEEVDGHGLEGSIYDKKEIKISVLKQPHFKWWHSWSRRNNINKCWARALEEGYKSGSWFISEEIVTLNDILKIENRYTGEIYL